MNARVPMEYPVDYIENGDGTMRPVYANADSRLRVYFRKIKRPDTQRMLETGEEVFTEEVLIFKKVKGSTNIPAARATEADKRRYRREWDAFQKGQGSEESNALSDLYGIRAYDIQTLNSIGIDTIQKLYDAEPELLEGVEGGEDLRKLAGIWLRSRKTEVENAKAVVVVASYKARNEELQAEIEELRKEIERKKSKRTKSTKKGTGEQ